MVFEKIIWLELCFRLKWFPWCKLFEKTLTPAESLKISYHIRNFPHLWTFWNKFSALKNTQFWVIIFISLLFLTLITTEFANFVNMHFLHSNHNIYWTISSVIVCFGTNTFVVYIPLGGQIWALKKKNFPVQIHSTHRAGLTKNNLLGTVPLSAKISLLEVNNLASYK